MQASSTKEKTPANSGLPNEIMELVLASSSVYRAELLSRLGIPFRIEYPNIDETRLENESPKSLVERLGRSKASVIAEQTNNALIIGSDQIAICNDRVLGKPGDHETAVDQLLFLSGKRITFLTSLCLINSISHKESLKTISTNVTLRELSHTQILHYLDKEKPFNCAGSFKSEGLGIALIKSIKSEDHSALVGLPLIELCNMLSKEGALILG